MARIRSIKPEFWDDRKLAKRTTRDARLLYIALWNLADEHARLNGDPQWIKGQVFSYDDDIDAAYIGKLLAELETPALGAVIAYEVDGDPYLFLPKLDRHQRLEPEKVKSRLPAPPIAPVPDPDGSPPSGSLSESHADMSARGADQSESGADEFARGADQSESDARSSALLYVAGGMEHGAGSRGVARGRVRDTPTVPHELPDDFTVTDAMRRWAHKTYPGLDLDFETAQFCRHFWGEGRRKKSWVDAWQKWIADSHKRLSQSSRASPGARNGHQPTHEDFDALRQNWARPLDDQEAGIDPRGNDQSHRVRRGRLPAAEDQPGVGGGLV